MGSILLRTLSVCIGLVSLANGVWAAVPSYNGTFEQSGNHSVAYALSRKVVRTFSEAGRIELEELRSRGYRCEAKPNQHWLCLKRIDMAVEDVPESLVERAYANEERNSLVRFGEIRGEPCLAFASEDGSFREWRIPQTVSVNTVDYSEFTQRELLLQDGSILTKIQIGFVEDYSFVEFLVDSSLRLKQLTFVGSDRQELSVWLALELDQTEGNAGQLSSQLSVSKANDRICRN